MQHHDTAPSASRRAVVISPNGRMAEELETLLQSRMAGSPTSHIRTYPSPRDLSGALGGGTAHLVFLDVNSDREQAIPLLAEIVRLGPSVQVIALLTGNDPDFILRCLRAGAADFLMHPFTADQIDAVLQ